MDAPWRPLLALALHGLCIGLLKVMFYVWLYCKAFWELVHIQTWFKYLKHILVCIGLQVFKMGTPKGGFKGPFF